MSHSASSQNGGRLEQASYIVHIYYLPVTQKTSIYQQNTALGANSGERTSLASKSSPSSVAGSGGNGSVATSSNNSGGSGGHRGGGGQGGSRYVPPHLRSGKGGGGPEDNGEDQGRGGYDQERGGERGGDVKNVVL